MARRETLTFTVRVDGIRGTLAAFRRLPKEANNALRDRTRALSSTLAGRIRAAAASDSSQSALVASTVKATRDRIPSVQAGGAGRVGRKRKAAHKILFGSEFGASQLKQFRPHRGQQGYWFFPTVESNMPEVMRAWQGIADDIIHEFESGDDS